MTGAEHGTAWATVDTFTLPKRGHRADECEDAIALRSSSERLGVAVADGATESAFARDWAEALVAAAVQPGGERLPEAIRTAQATLRSQIASRLTDLPWYAAQKAEAGAFAALLTLHVERAGGWTARAVGDVNLFHLREDALLRAWPLEDAGAFDNRPALLSSLGDPGDVESLVAAYTWRRGDVLLIATDAAAAYLLSDTAALFALAAVPQTEWAQQVETMRAGGMKNDDVALVRIRWSLPEAKREVGRR